MSSLTIVVVKTFLIGILTRGRSIIASSFTDSIIVSYTVYQTLQKRRIPVYNIGCMVVGE
jgi:hypothetical protein